MKIKCLHIFLCLLTAIAFASCSGQDPVKRPGTFIEEAQMMDIMTDVQLIEGELNYRNSQGEMIEQRARDYYSQLFEHYNITDSIFRENITYYTQNQQLLQKVMDSVFARLSKKQTQSQSETSQENTSLLTAE